MASHCPKCGTPAVSQIQPYCMGCGNSLNSSSVSSSTQGNYNNPTTNGKEQPKTWYLESILATILCCLPVGVIAILNANRVEDRFKAGDFQGAQKASDEAKKYIIIASILGIISIFITIISGVLQIIFENVGS